MGKLRKTLAFCLCCVASHAVTIVSAHALVIDEESGEILLEKDVATAAPIASMTKLMTAMVVLDAHLLPTESIRIDKADTLKQWPSPCVLRIGTPRRFDHHQAANARPCALH